MMRAFLLWLPLTLALAACAVPDWASPTGLLGAAPATLAPAALPSTRAAFGHYEAAREALAADQLAAAPATALAGALREAAAADASNAPALRAAAAHADALATAADLTAARHAFQHVSAGLVGLAEANPSLREGLYVFRCPMVSGFAKWVQTDPALANPYMGPSMLVCGSETDWSGGAKPEATAEPDAIAHYTCPMHPSVKASAPSACPLCGMDLVPVTHGQLASGEVIVDALRRQATGIRTAPLEVRALTQPLRAVGSFSVPNAARHVVAARVDGYIERLHVDGVGAPVRAGQPLLDLYSPELLATQSELLAATRAGQLASAAAAERRLRLWGLTAGQVASLAGRDAPLERVPLLAPTAGVLTAVNVVNGQRVAPGEALYELSDLRTLWLEIDVLSDQQASLAIGQQVAITLPDRPGETALGTVEAIVPTLDRATRTGRARLRVDNARGGLLPGQFAEVSLALPLGEVLAVPHEAVIFAGSRRLVFVDLGEGRLQPREIKLGRRAGAHYEVLDGLVAGEQLVVSGTFLVASESRLRSAAALWDGGEDVR